MLTLFGNHGYYCRTSSEQELCQSLAKKNLIKLKSNTKKTYILSTDGRAFLQYLQEKFSSSPHTIGDYSTYLKSIQRVFFSLRTNYRPFVKIPELRKKLVTQEQVIPDDETFSKALIWLHNKGDITLETGFTSNDSLIGIEAQNGKKYCYLIDVNNS